MYTGWGRVNRSPGSLEQYLLDEIRETAINDRIPDFDRFILHSITAKMVTYDCYNHHTVVTFTLLDRCKHVETLNALKKNLFFLFVCQ